ncbi:MAG: hypothetical protein A2744_04640 [Candidatus Buchananbacteria bacterium RIFCSPHIGHO2_01_FULL_44_11]|uniref:Uncharacterized protein n=1 Tax=Candidatus Buchananbacteria bacterium RIFCSPHIGHO2_01_FULL_44_11 TaxID=1797535 RepID=A0A1G1Y1Z4_9BACT|nr:MAG: hypothetical protein A2744_04640 [Candidatus Buchananbacteria bacterium RIFCSPHIGHO2_01_FULL_44_11]
MERYLGIEKISITALILLAIIGFAWSVTSFLTTSKIPVSRIENTPENFAAFKAAELPDKCQTPPDYTETDWLDHMSHHPDQYQECLAQAR